MQVKGGKCMIINDNGREYDTEKIEEYSSYTQGLVLSDICLDDILQMAYNKSRYAC